MRYLALLLLLSVSATAQVKFKIKLDYDNTSCTNGNVCTSEVYRAICPSSTCPSFASQPDQFIKLPTPDSTNSTQTVTASNTHFTYIDNDKAQYALQYSTMYAYAVRNTYTANPSYPGSSMQIGITTPSGVHSAVINWSNASCRTTSTCTIQVYRAQCSSPTSCPAYTPGNSAWTKLDMTTNLTTNTTAQSTTWQYTDQQIVGSVTYAWVATNSYTGATTQSPASQSFSGTTTVGTTKEKK